MGPLGLSLLGPRLQKARAKAFGLCSAKQGGVLRWEYRSGPNMPGLNWNRRTARALWRRCPWGDSAESSGGRYGYLPGVEPVHGVKAPTGFLESPRGICRDAPYPPEAKPSAACTYMASDFSPTCCFDPVDRSLSNSFSVMVQVHYGCLLAATLLNPS